MYSPKQVALVPLSDEQRATLWGPDGRPLRGLHTLSARPGTGKTSTVTEYCIDVVADWSARYLPWQGLGVVSYTNVAKDELQRKIADTAAARILLGSPHFVGTLDTFINQYLFLPHGSQAMGYLGGRPRLTGEPHHQWASSWPLDKSRPPGAYTTAFFDCYSVAADDRPVRLHDQPRKLTSAVTRPAWKVTDGNIAKVLDMKKHVWAHGSALQADANYLAYKALRGSPSLTRAFIHRFPALIIDEAQDMTEVQHATIDHLVSAGHQHVVLVGDEHQAIYEWNTARPQLFTAKGAPGTNWQRAALTESYRCSPAICAALTTLASDGSPLRSADNGKNKTYAAPVEVVTYTNGQDVDAVRAAITGVVAWLTGRPPHDDSDGATKSLAVLSRGAADVQRLEGAFTGAPATSATGISWAHPLTREYLKVVHLVSQTRLYQAARVYELLLTRAGNHESVPAMRAAVMHQWSVDRDAYRRTLFLDLTAIARATLPLGSLRVSHGRACCDVQLVGIPADTLRSLKRSCQVEAHEDGLLSSIFTAPEERTWHNHASSEDVRLTFSTTHKVKGETHDAVVFYAKKTVRACGCPRSTTSGAGILDHSILECETKRITYVALSRAAQRLVIVAPQQDAERWQNLTQPEPVGSTR